MAPADDPSDAARDARMQDLDAKLAAVRKRRAPPPPRKGGGRFVGHELAWSMVLDLAAGIVVGAGLGWGIDVLAGTKPLFLIVMVLLGFGAGIRVMLQSAAAHQERLKRIEAAHEAGLVGRGGKQQAAARAPDKNDGAAAPRNEGD